MSNFVQMCVNGEALMEEIDDFVDRWHEESGDIPLNRFLGMTKLEYKLWVADESMLPYIITAHRNHQKVDELVDAIGNLPLAARAGSPQSALKLLKWLKSEGLLEE